MSLSPPHADLTRRAEAFLEEHYGPDGPHPLPYHGLLHSQAVAADARRIANHIPEGSFTTIDILDLALAGIMHDLIQDPNDAADNELRSAELAVEWMKADGRLGRASQDIVYNGVLATKLVVEDGRVRQSPRFDQKLGGIVLADAIVADADLASLGKPWDAFHAMGRRLFQEHFPGAPLAGPQATAFDHEQVRFLGGHEFYTVEARRLFPFQDDNRDRIIDRLAAAGEDVGDYR